MSEEGGERQWVVTDTGIIFAGERCGVWTHDFYQSSFYIKVSEWELKKNKDKEGEMMKTFWDREQTSL